jgi:hypothetical protein
MKIQWYGSDGYARFTGMQFSRLDENNNQIKYPADCKEVFADEFWQWKRDKTFKILLTRKIISTDPDPRPLNAENTQELLNLVEEEMGFPKSKVSVVEDVPEKDKPMSCLAIESPNEWSHTSPLLHFYLLLVRNGSGHTPGKTWQQTLAKFRRVKSYQGSDRPQFIAISKVMMEIVKDKGKISGADSKSSTALSPSHLDRNTTKEAREWHLGLGIVQYAHLRAQELHLEAATK